MFKMKTRSDGIKSVEDLQKEKALLEKELVRLSSEISERSGNTNGNGHADANAKSITPAPASKSGYLFKWQDRSIGWGGTKWDLRFVRLEKGRLSYYKTHGDTAPRYLLTLKNCAVRDDGYKPNKRFRGVKESDGDVVPVRTPGAHHHVFSIYQRPKGAQENATAELDHEDDIVPLLRFSTESYAEKMLWMELLVQACAYCDSDDFKEEDAIPVSFPTADMPSSAHGTLPLLYFAPPPPTRLKRRPSNSSIKKVTSASHLKLNTSKESAKSNSKRTSDYPPSKPMHRSTAPSYLSDDAPMQNYRGLLNLGLIILLISNFRILLGTMREYGFVMSRGFLEKKGEELTVGDVDLPLLGGMLLLNVFVVVAYFIELCTSRKIWKEWFGISLHVINTNAALFIPMAIVWYHIESPVNGILLLLSASVLWMKLISYVHANADYRHFPERSNHTSTSFIQNIDEVSKTLSYPRNVTLGNIYYYWFAPTLTYQIVFPRLLTRSLTRILTLLMRLFLSNVLIVFLIAQVVGPSLSNMIEELEAGQNMFSVHIFAEYLLKLGIASTYIWLLVFYGFFHVLLNLLAEILMFGDRVFYKDWWNSSNLSSYWRLWNLPVHYWLVRHLYFPCIRVGMPKTGATFMVFFFSAVMHEMLISIPFHMIRSYSFLGMMSQIPLVMITKYFDKQRPGSSIGNFIFWLSFCILGQPMAVILYTIDYWKLKSGVIETEVAPACSGLLWMKTCGAEL